MTGSSQGSLHWDGDAVVAVDQCALPDEYRLLRLCTPDEVIDAIKRLAIRGAPAIGVAGALAVALSARAHITNPAFDVTPSELITAVVTEVGIHRSGGTILKEAS
jgi:methylthioribose-1-phosphate isomerase